MKKITLATVKSFIRNNQDNLYIKVKSNFDGMQDMVCEVKSNFTKVNTSEWAEKCKSNTLGIVGAWFVGQSRDYFSNYEGEEYRGIEVHNCCGSFILATKS